MGSQLHPAGSLATPRMIESPEVVLFALGKCARSRQVACGPAGEAAAVTVGVEGDPNFGGG